MYPTTGPWSDLPRLPDASAKAVGTFVRRRFEARYPETDGSFITRRFHNLEAMFAGEYEGFQAMDTLYHDLEHTLQATLCMVCLLEGREARETQPAVDARTYSLALLAIMLHDLGYLKRTGDNTGTGAKYTDVHEIRSCEHARSYLERRGETEADIRTVENLIRCTGPRADLARIPFQNPLERELGLMVCTADFIGQMSDPRYVEKLPTLYGEFLENYEYRGIPVEERPFQSYDDLLQKTPGFWTAFVVPRMTDACDNVWRYLEDPATGRNPWREAIEANLTRLRAELSPAP